MKFWFPLDITIVYIYISKTLVLKGIYHIYGNFLNVSTVAINLALLCPKDDVSCLLQAPVQGGTGNVQLCQLPVRAEYYRQHEWQTTPEARGHGGLLQECQVLT